MRPPLQGSSCTQEYRPVCAQRGERRQTFSNDCMAWAENFTIVHQGECTPRRM